MLTRLPHLTIFRPSPTTTAFTVSTSIPPRSLSSHLLHHLLLLSRVLLGLVVIITLHAKSSYTSAQVVSSSISNRIALIPWTTLAPATLVSLLLVFRRFHSGAVFFLFFSHKKSLSHLSRRTATKNLSISKAEESLITLRTLGIQTRSLSPWYLLPATTRFIPTSQILDIFIHEAFRGFEVRYYLAVVVEGEEDVVVVFSVRSERIFGFGFFRHGRILFPQHAD